MSEHTKHTSWPLEVGGRSYEYNSPSNPREEIIAFSPHGAKYRFGYVNYPTTGDGYVGAEERKENARRLVACWNACKDVDNETLEKLASGDMDGSEIFELAKLKRQHDELLEALRKIAALNVPIDIVDVMDETARKAVDIADGAIASAEGES